MSEYQCYEFVALDRSLTPEQTAELRKISSRAEITPTRFWNEYQYGDLKADPAKLVERYFDAHMFVANWGTHRLMLRVPRERVDPEGLRRYFVGGAVSARLAGQHVILDLRSEDEEPDFDGEPQGSLAVLAPVRAELMRGDRRVAYLAWLLAVQSNEVADGAQEPPVPAGLHELTAAQTAMVEFLRIDEDLLAAAAAASAPQAGDLEALRTWTLGLPQRAKDTWLARAVDDPDLALGAELLRAFRDQRPPSRHHGRRVADLQAAAEEIREGRVRGEALAEQRAARAVEAARAKRLDALSARLDTAWVELEALIEKRDYDGALKLALELNDVATRDGLDAAFAERFKGMRKRMPRRRSFFERYKGETVRSRRPGAD